MNGMDLPSLAPNSYDLLIGDGKDAKSRTIEIKRRERSPSCWRLIPTWGACWFD